MIRAEAEALLFERTQSGALRLRARAVETAMRADYMGIARDTPLKPPAAELGR